MQERHLNQIPVRTWTRVSLSAAVAALLLGAAPAWSLPVTLNGTSNSAQCDVLGLSVGQTLDEIGTNPAVPVSFPADSVITASHVSTSLSSCAPDGADPNYEITITNTTGRSFTDLWYVADTSTVISNHDGTAQGGRAFKIDAVGVNQPLISESLSSDGVFQVGESWVFVLQDWRLAGQGTSPSDFRSAGSSGCIGGCSHFSPQSTGSIIAIVPEPATGLLFATGLASLAMRGRRR